MYFEDLSPCSYDDAEPGAISVGWLDKAHDYTHGEVPDGFIKRLSEICKTPAVRHRGFHGCEFCRFDIRLHFEQAWTAGALSSTIIKVQAQNGRIYQAPGMICHYITRHSYRPPEEFIAVVMGMDLPIKEGAKH
jgi:hypothetical protein